MSALFRLTLRQILGGTRLWFLVLLLSLPALLVLLILAFSRFRGTSATRC